MRATPILTALLLATTALVAAAPAAEARADVCTSLTSPACPGYVCQDKDADRVFEPHECTGRDDVDPCLFMSDCCGGPLGTGFWCPEDW